MVFNSKFGMACVVICVVLLFGGYVNLFHLVLLFTGMLGGVGGVS